MLTHSVVLDEAIAVAIEGGGYGASSAAPVARKIFDTWLAGQPAAPAEPVLAPGGE